MKNNIIFVQIQFRDLTHNRGKDNKYREKTASSMKLAVFFVT